MGLIDILKKLSSPSHPGQEKGRSAPEKPATPVSPSPPVSFEVQDGWLVVPPGTTEIPDQALKNRKDLQAAVIPSTVKRIGEEAFMGCTALTAVELSEGVEELARGAFFHTGLTDITLPSSIRRTGLRVFGACSELKEFHHIGVENPLVLHAEFLRLRGTSVLVPARCTLPETPYWKEPAFCALAKACSAGDAEAMDRITALFQEKADAQPEVSFFSYAANFWRFRAWQHGSLTAKAQLEAWFASAKQKQLPSAGLTEDFHGSCKGEFLNALGFSFFEPGRWYTLEEMDEDGVVLASSYFDEDGPDSDGFGREEYYDWWFLDDRLNPVPGSPMIHSFSHIDRRINPKLFQERHDTVAQAIRARRSR